MAENTRIEWADHTFNPWTGCQKVSPGCDHCYAEGWSKRSGLVEWGPHGERRRTSAANWRQPIIWDRKAAAAGKRARVFCASLADVFDNHLSISQHLRLDLWHLIETTINLDWLLLTKRPQNIARFLPPSWLANGCPPNVWLGTTVENQAEADRRIPHLLSAPAKVRFLSCEPLLCHVDLAEIAEDRPDLRASVIYDALRGTGGYARRSSKINWVICGGESGPGARPMHPDWARSLRDQCQAAGVAFHFKQWGEWFPGEIDDMSDGQGMVALPDIEHDPSADQWEGRWKYAVVGDRVKAGMLRVGKKSSGRLLDGRTWDEVPG